MSQQDLERAIPSRSKVDGGDVDDSSAVPTLAASSHSGLRSPGDAKKGPYGRLFQASHSEPISPTRRGTMRAEHDPASFTAGHRYGGGGGGGGLVAESKRTIRERIGRLLSFNEEVGDENFSSTSPRTKLLGQLYASSNPGMGPNFPSAETITKRHYPSRRGWIRISDKGEVSKMAAARRHITDNLKVAVRDVRILDTVQFGDPSRSAAFINPRERAIVFGIESIRMVIGHDQVIVLEEQTFSAEQKGKHETTLTDHFIKILTKKLKEGALFSGFHISRPQSPQPREEERTMDESFRDWQGGDLQQDHTHNQRESDSENEREFRAFEAFFNNPSHIEVGVGAGPLNPTHSGSEEGERPIGTAADTSPTRTPYDASNPKTWREEPKEEEDLDFEFLVLECALDVICGYYSKCASGLRKDLLPALETLAKGVNSANLDRVRRLKSYATRLTQRVSKIREELVRFLDDDSDMRELYLTRKVCCPHLVDTPHGPTSSMEKGGPGQSSSLPNLTPPFAVDDDSDVVEAENLLEAYFIQIDAIMTILAILSEYVDDTEDYINIELDFKRNELIQLELLLTMGTFAVAIYGVIAGIFGMNLKSVPLDINFTALMVGTFIACLLAFGLILIYCWRRRLIAFR